MSIDDGRGAYGLAALWRRVEMIPILDPGP